MLHFGGGDDVDYAVLCVVFGRGVRYHFDTFEGACRE